MTPLLEVRDLAVRYSGLNAVDHVSLTVEPGTLIGLIGPNGAGKTTLVDALTGFTTPTTGAVFFGGENITRTPAHRRSRQGLARTFQSIELFEDLTVREHLLVSTERPHWFSMVADALRPHREPDGDDAIDWALDLLDLSEHAHRLPRELSQGQRKLVGVARALATRPALVLLDEPAAGLDTHESEMLGQRLRGLLDHGITVLLVDHDMGLVLGVCDSIWVLEFGRIIAHATPDEIRSNEAVVAAYLGGQSERRPERGSEPGDAPAESPT
jgi:branched-chain amino acid transport system ATP-binding protein